MKEYLDSIEAPEDIKGFDYEQLAKLAEEIRGVIIKNVLNTGGHLASSLGAVELVLALHYVFDSPKDRLIFDVGHQAYAHKIITGRRKEFSSLRQYGGISGFLKPYESEHDVFAGGHCSTSISAALGMARARDLSKEDYSIVAVIGDGAMTGGMVYEALNDLGHNESKAIIVLNDNGMSISENVGAVHAYLSGLRTASGYIRVKKDVSTILKKIPIIGNDIFKLADSAKKHIKYLFVKGILFEEMGFTYIGVIDGHNIRDLVKALNATRRAAKPVILHIHTKKGKGYTPAEENPESYHGIQGRGLSVNGKESNSQIFGRKIKDMAEKNEKIVAVSAAMPSGTGLDDFKKKYPERFFDVGIAEQHGVTMCAGLAKCGYTPVFAVYSSFFQRAYDQVIHDVCIQNLPLVFALDRAGIVGEDGETHHGVYDLSFLSHIPNMTILSPSSACELEMMLEYAVELKRPVAIRYPRENFERHNIINTWKIDEWEEIFPPENVTIIATGKHVHTALKAREISKTSFGIYNARSIKPLDRFALNGIASRSKRVIIVEDNSTIGGLGSLVESYVAEKGFCVITEKMGIPDRFISHGSTTILNETLGLTVEGICRVVEKSEKRI